MKKQTTNKKVAIEETMASHLFNQIDAMNSSERGLINRSTTSDVSRREVLLVASKPYGGINIFFADFLDDGLFAAVTALPIVELFREMTEKNVELVEIIDTLNNKLRGLLPNDLGLFYPACLVEVEKRGNMIAVWNGGLSEIVVVDLAQSKITHKIGSSTPFFGDSSFNIRDINIEYINVSSDHKVFINSGHGHSLLNENEAISYVDQCKLQDLLEHSPISEKVISSIVADARKTGQQLVNLTLVEIDIEKIMSFTQSLNKKEQSQTKLASNWKMDFTFSADTIRTLDINALIVNAIMEIQGINGHRQRLYTVIAEMSSNAIDHGILKLDSTLKQTPEGFSEYYQVRSKRLACLKEGELSFALTHSATSDGGQLIVCVEDSGNGFNYEAYSKVRLDKKLPYGRGEMLLRQLCKKVKYQGKGNILQVVYEWTP